MRARHIPSLLPADQKADPGFSLNMYTEGRTVEDAEKLPLNMLDALRAPDESEMLKTRPAQWCHPTSS